MFLPDKYYKRSYSNRKEGVRLNIEQIIIYKNYTIDDKTLEILSNDFLRILDEDHQNDIFSAVVARVKKHDLWPLNYDQKQERNANMASITLLLLELTRPELIDNTSSRKYFRWDEKHFK